MKEKLELVKFNLTPIMARELIEFNTLKKELLKLKSKEILNEDDLIKIKELENKLNKTRVRFVKEFRDNNQEEIEQYLKIMNHY